MTDEAPNEIATASIAVRPEELEHYPLSTSRRGYDQGEVDDLIDRLGAQTRDLMAEVEALRADRRQLLERLEQDSEAESALKRTLLTAQRAAEASVQEAHEQADAIRTRALERAESLLGRAAEQAQELRDAALRRARADEAEARRRRRILDEHVAALRAFAEDHRDRVAHHLRQQLDRLDAMDLPEPPPVPSTDHDEVLEEPVLDRGVDELVADLEHEQDGHDGHDGHDEARDDRPDGWDDGRDDGDGSSHDERAAPAAATVDEVGGIDLDRATTTRDIDLEELLAQVDEAAAEVEDTDEVVGGQAQDVSPGGVDVSPGVEDDDGVISWGDHHGG